jgi:hypothetical protein
VFSIFLFSHYVNCNAARLVDKSYAYKFLMGRGGGGLKESGLESVKMYGKLVFVLGILELFDIGMKFLNRGTRDCK